MIDHSSAWALIPWYGDDGLGAPTLDDWRVWADWLRAHDPDDERDAAIAQCLAGWSLGGGWCVSLWAVGEALSDIYAYAMWPSDSGARMRVRAVRQGFSFIGFEVQPARREMCGPAMRAFLQVAEALAWEPDVHVAGRPPGLMAVAHIGDTERRGADVAPSSRQPRNPMRRGSTGAHGRARR